MEQISINILPKGAKPVCHSSQFDEGRQIMFNLFNDATPYTLSGTETISVLVRKPNGAEVVDSVTNTSDSYVVWDVSADACELSGVCECELSIVENGTLLGSKNFTMKVEEDAYGGRNIEVRTASGRIATFFTNMVEAFKSLKTDINPVQDLHGYSKPWSGGGGKNKLQITATTQTSGGVTFTIDNEGVITTSGTFSSSVSLVATANFLLKAGTYILNGCPSGGSYSRYVVRIENASAQRLALDMGNGEQFTLAEDTLVWCRIYIYSQDGVGKTFKPMVRLATESDSSFAPYSNICPISGFSALNVTLADGDMQTVESKTVNFGQTVYGGLADVTNGKVTITHAIIDLGTFDWITEDSALSGLGRVNITQVAPLGVKYFQTPICTQFEGTYSKGYNLFNYGEIGFSNADIAPMIRARSTEFIGKTNAQIKALMSGVMLCYELATPIEITTTPENLTALNGVNNVYGDTNGDTEVEYYIEV